MNPFILLVISLFAVLLAVLGVVWAVGAVHQAYIKHHPVVLEVAEKQFIIELKYGFGYLSDGTFLNRHGSLVKKPKRLTTLEREEAVFDNSTHIENAIVYWQPPEVTGVPKTLKEIKTEELLDAE